MKTDSSGTGRGENGDMGTGAGRLREITVISGKGGTGKTSLCGSFAALAGGSAVLADCDVDAANLGLILRPERLESHDFSASQRAVIDPEICTGCGRCEAVCRSEAVIVPEGWRGGDDPADTRPALKAEPFIIDPLSCEGCGVCSHVCPWGAITMKSVTSGQWFVSDTPYGTLVHARLGPGEENSGKLVTIVRNKARETARAQGKGLVLIDGPPGIGCAVIASLSGVSTALIVTEPTLSAMHDMDRVLAVCRHFEIPALVAVNRCDLNEGNTRTIEKTCAGEGLEVVARIPYDPEVTRAMVSGRPVVEHSDSEVSGAIRDLWERLKSEPSGGK